MNKYFFRLDRRRRHKASRYRSYACIAGIISVVLGYGLAKADTDLAPLLPPANTLQQTNLPNPSGFAATYNSTGMLIIMQNLSGNYRNQH